MSVWDRFWLTPTIEPDLRTEPESPTDVISIGSAFSPSEDEYQGKLGSYRGDAGFDSLETPGTKYDVQVTGSAYVDVRSIPSPSASVLTSSGMSGQSIMYYSKEPSLLNFSSGE